VKWMVESERMIEALRHHDWWSRHPDLLRDDVRHRAECHAEAEGKNVYQQHVLRAAADAAEKINNETWARRRKESSVSL
jgi:hypothetical protein